MAIAVAQSMMISTVKMRKPTQIRLVRAVHPGKCKHLMCFKELETLYQEMMSKRLMRLTRRRLRRRLKIKRKIAKNSKSSRGAVMSKMITKIIHQRKNSSKRKIQRPSISQNQRNLHSLPRPKRPLRQVMAEEPSILKKRKMRMTT